MPRTTLEALADATRTPLPWRPPQRAASQDPVPPSLAGALATFAAPEVIVDLDLVVRGGGRLCSWHRLRGDRVTAVSAADDETLALAWFDAARWPGALARTATVEVPDAGRHPRRPPSASPTRRSWPAVPVPGCVTPPVACE